MIFPPVVIGTVLTTMGITLLGVSAGDITNYAEGVPATRDRAKSGASAKSKPAESKSAESAPVDGESASINADSR